MHEANRMKRLPLYLFTIIDELKAEAKARGVDPIDLGMGNPDLPTPPHVVEALSQAAKKETGWDSRRYCDGKAALLTAWPRRSENSGGGSIQTDEFCSILWRQSGRRRRALY